MKVKHKTIDVSTIKGLKEAEKLKNKGWKIGSVGLFTVQLWRDKNNENRQK